MTDLTHRGQALLQDLDGFSIEIDAERERADIILHRPPFNVISMHARDQLRAAFEALDEDDRVRVIVVRANGEHFSSGGDIRGFLEASPEHVSKLAWNIAAPARCSKPVIAANRGFCFGVGFELSLACDFRIATETYVLCAARTEARPDPGFGRLGALAADGRHRHDQGHRDALAPHSGQAGLRVGHRGRVRADAELEAATDALVDELRAFSPLAQRTAKKLLNDSEDAPLSIAIELEGHCYSRLRTSDDFREGVEAFHGKRKPVFRGS